jgi:hypothetical protein
MNTLSMFLVSHSHVSTGNSQYSETNVMHFLFSLLRSKGLYMFRALVAHPQEALHKWHLVYGVCMCYVSWLHQGWSGTGAAN